MFHLWHVDRTAAKVKPVRFELAVTTLMCRICDQSEWTNEPKPINGCRDLVIFVLSGKCSLLGEFLL